MSNAKGALSLLLVLAAGLVWAPSARADSQARIVRLSLVSGPVQIDRGQGFEKAIMNMPIAQGMKLWAKGDSRAEVEFEDGATMRLTPGAKVDFEQLTLLDNGAKASTVRVNGGSVYFNTPHKGNNDFRVAFDGEQFNLNHAVHFRLDLTLDKVQVAVFKGELMLDGPKGEIKVKKNETASQERAIRDSSGSISEKGTFELAKGIAPGPYDEWDAYRIQFEDQYASARSHDVPYYYGRSDLNYYGSWGLVPGYGYLWRPFGVGYGWDPFYTGAWAWYPGWGYTWVSGYPWGWIPFRYGSWLWVPNYGWCWRSGGFNNWAVIPPVQNPPPMYRAPQPPVPPPSSGNPTIIVRRLPDPDAPNPRGRPSDFVGRATPRVPAGNAATPTAAVPVTSTAATATAPATTQPATPVRSFVPTSGPGRGRLPAPLDAAGVAVVRGGAGRMRGDAVRPMSMPDRSSRPSAPRIGGSHPASSPPSRSQPAAPRVSSPPSGGRTAAPAGTHSASPSKGSSGGSKRN